MPRNEDGAAVIDAGAARGVSLTDALARTWPTDAHCTAYAPVRFEGKAMRLTGDVFDAPPPDFDGVHMVAMIADFDGPDHEATAEWRTETRAKLEASGLAYYETRGGFRGLRPLAEHLVISSQEGAAEWTRLYLGWCEWLEQTYGLKPDRACKDWPHLFRLPNVRRDGKPARAQVNGELAPYDPIEAGHWCEPTGARGSRGTHVKAAASAAANDTTFDLDDFEMAEAVRIAREHPPAVQGGEPSGHNTLFACACKIAVVVGPNPDVIEHVLREFYNERCEPPWEPHEFSQIRHKARDAAEGVNNAVAISLRRTRRAERAKAEAARRGTSQTGEQAEPRPANDDWLPLTDTPKRREYLIPELEIGPGRPTGLIGQGNASKTIAAMQLLAEVAAGKRVFGRFDVKPGEHKAMHLLYEGYAIASENYARIVRGLGVSFESVATRLRFRRATKQLTDLDAEDWLTELTDGFSVCAIDAYSNTIQEVDENTPQAAAPLRMLERVSARNGCTFIVLHHTRKDGKGERGTGAIKNSLDVSIVISTDDASGAPLPRGERLVTSDKRVRYGFDAFALKIEDRDESGKPWELTAERKRAGECSHALRIVADGAPAMTAPSSGSEAKAAKAAASKLLTLEGGLQRLVTTMKEQPYTVSLNREKCRVASGVKAEHVPDVVALGVDRGLLSADYGGRVWEVTLTPKAYEAPAHGNHWPGREQARTGGGAK